MLNTSTKWTYSKCIFVKILAHVLASAKAKKGYSMSTTDQVTLALVRTSDQSFPSELWRMKANFGGIKQLDVP